jgi:hypothetical protein
MNASSLFDPSVTLFWPHSSLLLVEDRGVSAAIPVGCTPMSMGMVQTRWKPMEWWFGRRNNYLVGICCTEWTIVDPPVKSKDGRFSPGKGLPHVDLVVSRYYVGIDGKYSGCSYNNVMLCDVM